jgi:aspartate/methionine/tyrosine aminotransferase
MRERTLTLQSFSKAYAIPGFRAGYLAAPASVCQAIARFICAQCRLQTHEEFL